MKNTNKGEKIKTQSREAQALQRETMRSQKKTNFRWLSNLVFIII
jgi:hypothetical protein